MRHWHRAVYDWRQQLLKSALSPTAKVVGVHLANHPQHPWHGGRVDVAAACNLSVRTVQRALRELEGDGWLMIERGTGREESEYWLARRGSKLSPQGRQERPPRGDDFDTLEAGDEGEDEVAARRRLREAERP